MITHSALKDLLHYDPETGVFTTARKRGKWAAGRVAGSISSTGYVVIKIGNVQHKAHRLAFLYMNASMPTDQVDHINGVRHDNRFINLREVSQTENQRNAKRRADNRSNVTGVHWYSRYGCWHVGISSRHVGYFKNLEEAIAARKAAEVSLGYHQNHGRLHSAGFREKPNE